jgi:hypothetical protein
MRIAISANRPSSKRLVHTRHITITTNATTKLKRKQTAELRFAAALKETNPSSGWGARLTAAGGDHRNRKCTQAIQGRRANLLPPHALRKLQKPQPDRTLHTKTAPTQEYRR